MRNILIFVGVCVFVGLASAASAQFPTQEVSVIAKRYSFYPSQIVVRKGQPLRLYLTSTDTTHGISLPDFKINQQVKQGEITTIDFTPDKTGSFPFRCSVFCGLGHLGMSGKLIVVE